MFAHWFINGFVASIQYHIYKYNTTIHTIYMYMYAMLHIIKSFQFE